MPKIPDEFGQLPLNFESSGLADLLPCVERGSSTPSKVVSLDDFRKLINSNKTPFEDRKRAVLLEILEDAKRLTW